VSLSFSPVFHRADFQFQLRGEINSLLIRQLQSDGVALAALS